MTKYVMVPQHARRRYELVLEREQRLRERAEHTPLNVLEAGTADLGIITSGAAYGYAREAFPKAWFLKLGMSNPLPYGKVAKLYQQVSRVAVVEELDPFLEDQVRALGVPVEGKQVIPANGELDQETIFRALEPFVQRKPPRRRRPVIPAPPRIVEPPAPGPLPQRAPVLCPGCGHRSVFAALRKRSVVPMGDIGCYTLGALPPLLALDTCLCMGAGIGMMSGFNTVLGRKAAASVIGDSTFFHSGVTSLIDARYNGADGLVIVLDNRTTAMTGHQGHPGTGARPDRSAGPAVDVQRLCQGIGVRCATVDAHDFTALTDAIKAEIETPGLGVLVARAPCALTVGRQPGRVVVDEERCNLCGICLDLGCPAMLSGDDSVEIDEACAACGLCAEVCRRGAISCELESPGEGA